jgi:hypothetical protein
MATQMRPIWPSGDPQFDMPGLKRAIEGKIKGRIRRGRRRMQLLNDFKEMEKKDFERHNHI